MDKWLINLSKASLSVLTVLSLWSCDGKMELKTSPVDMGKDCQEACPKITKVFPLAAKPGETLSLKGEHFKEGMSVETPSGEFPVTVISATEAVMETPEGGPGEVMMAAKLDRYRDDEVSFFRLALDHPLITDQPSEICSGKKFYNAKGELQEGTKNCSPDLTGLDPKIILEGYIVAGVKGALAYCSLDGEEGCVTKGVLKAAVTTDLADKVLAGKTVAGIAGTYSPEFPDPANVRANDRVNGVAGSLMDCSVDGSVGCVATSSFKAADMTSVLASNIRIGNTIAGVSGSYNVGGPAACSSDGEVGCETNATYKAALTTGLADKVLSGQTVAGVGGNVTLPVAGSVLDSVSYGVNGSSLTGSIADCSSNGEDGCYLDSGGSFDAADLSNLSAGNIKSGVTIAGQVGDYPSSTYPLASNTGATDLTSLGSGTTPGSYEFFDSAGSVYSTTVAAGGTVTPTTSQQDFSGASTVYNGFSVAGDTDLVASNIKSSVDLFGVGGSVTEAPAACNADGDTACVANGTYTAALTTGLADKVLSGQTVAGVGGNITLPSVGDVENGVTFGVGGNGSTGTFAVPTVADVQDSVTFGASGTEFTGTFTEPGIGNVESGVTYGGGGSEFTGTFAVPAIADVESSVTFGAAGSEFTGTFTEPGIGNVESGVAYGGGGNEFTGTFGVPAEANVATGINFGASGTEFTGSASVEAHTNCTGDGDTGCVATATYTAAFTTGLGDKVLSGQTVAGVGGNITLPSVGDVESGVTFGVGGNGSTGTFAVPAVADVQDSVTFGASGAEFTGTFTEPGIGNVESGVTYGGGGNEFTGTFAVPAIADVESSVAFGADGSEFTGTFTEPGIGNVESGVAYGGGGNEFTGTFAIPTEANVASGINFGGSGTEFTGSATLSPGNCSSDGSTNCVATATYTAALTTGLGDKVLSGQTVAGVGGNIVLPSVGDVESGVTFGIGGNGSTGTFAVPAIGDVQVSVQYGASGSEFTGTFGVPALAEVETGVTYGGGGNEFTGTATLESHSNCTGANQDSCIATATYKTMDLSNKDGGGALDLNSTDFLTRMKSASLFEYWDDTGTRYTANGDSDIISTNIKTGIDIFGAAGSVAGTGTPPDPFDVRVGKVVNGVTGKLKVNCRNRANLSIWDQAVPQAATVDDSTDELTVAGHGFSSNDQVRVSGDVIPTGLSGNDTTYYVIYVDANTIKLSASSGPGGQIDITTTGTSVSVFGWQDATVDWWDTIGNYDNNGNSLPTEQPSGWTSDHMCGKELWRDETADGACDSAGDDCMMRDEVTGLLWSEGYPVTGVAPAGSTKDWSAAVSHCDSLNYGGRTDWRLPTQMELQTAYLHGIRELGYKGGGTIRPSGDTLDNNDLFIANVDLRFWSASSISDYPANAWYVGLHYGVTLYTSKTDSYRLLCVASDAATSETAANECSSDGATGCMTNSEFKSADMSAATPDNIKTGVTIAGELGTYGGAGPGLCTSDGQVGCQTDTTYKAALTTGAADKILFGQSLAGVSGNITLPGVGTVLDSETYGVGGNGSTGTIADCSSNGQDSCYLDSGTSFDAGDLTNLTAGNIKSGVTIAGQAGDYPSSTYPLPSASATADLDSATFNAKVKSGAAFEYWTSDGSYQSGAGDADIAAGNILSGVSIFGTSGSVAVPQCTAGTQGPCESDSACRWTGSACELNPWHIRSGITIGGQSGSIKANCRNRANGSDWWDTIDNYNNNGNSLPTEQPSGWTSDHMCGKELWSDETADGACDSAGDDCLMRDEVTGLLWSEGYPVTGVASADSTKDWSAAVSHCDSLDYGGRTDWRLPTQMELQTAYLHGIRELGYKGGGTIRPSGDTLDNNDLFIANVDTYFWSASSHSANPANAWDVFVSSGYAYASVKTNSKRLLCVAP